MRIAGSESHYAELVDLPDFVIPSEVKESPVFSKIWRSLGKLGMTDPCEV